MHFHKWKKYILNIKRNCVSCTTTFIRICLKPECGKKEQVEECLVFTPSQDFNSRVVVIPCLHKTDLTDEEFHKAMGKVFYR